MRAVGVSVELKRAIDYAAFGHIADARQAR